MTFMYIKCFLFVDGYKVPGKLHLNSRSLIFEPSEIELPLLRFKFCDAMRLKVVPELSAKAFQTKFTSHSSGASAQPSILGKIFLKDRLKEKLTKTGATAGNSSSSSS